jgi:subtilisin family serine protease
MNAKSIFVKLKPEFNQLEKSVSDKFNTAPFQRASDQFPIKDIRLTGNRKLQNTYVLYFESTIDVNRAISAFNDTQMFEYVEPNYGGTAGGQKFEVAMADPDDPLFSRQWGMKNDGTFPLAPSEAGVDIKMEEAWEIEQGSPDLIIAVLDSGAKWDHPELAGRLWTNPDETLDGIDNDNNGYIDDVNGWDFAYEDANPWDDVGHGTNIIGLLASNTNNTTAYAGINWNSRIMNIKMLNEDNAYLDGAWAVDAIYYAVDEGADIINMSWGGPGFTAMQDAIQYAHNNGVVLTAAMMNFDNNTPYFPAAYAETIAVGSIDPDGDRSSPFYWDPNSGSNFGPHIDLIAPGNYTYNITHTSNTNYNIYWGGTSQAAPHVAGVASLLLSQDPSLSPEQVRMLLTTTADDQTGDPAEDTPGFDIYYGHGRLNAFAALGANLSVNSATAKPVSVFPNPVAANGTLTLQADGAILKSAELFNVLGQRTASFHNENEDATFSIPIGNVAPGLYLLKIQRRDSDQYTTVRIVVSK